MVEIGHHRTRLTCEAHLPAFRPLVLVRRAAARKRSWTGWAVFLGLIVLNECRGLYVVVQVLKAWSS